MVAVVVVDLVLTWLGAPVGWLCQLVRVLSVGTVVTNAIAGWPDRLLLAPWRTLLLWRRMALWQITSYRTAIDTERQVRRATRPACGRMIRRCMWTRPMIAWMRHST